MNVRYNSYGTVYDESELYERYLPGREIGDETRVVGGIPELHERYLSCMRSISVVGQVP